MPIGSWGSRDSPLLSGLFGVFQSAAGAYQSTADIWQQLRVNAATWQFQAQGGGELPSLSELEQQGRQILSTSGVGIQEVNTYRALAGSWRSAKENLQAADPGQQITAPMIFQPPWAQTTAPGVDARYRIRVEWQIEPAAGDVFTSWGTYELTSPLSSISDALAQASALVAQTPTSATPPGATVVGVNDYEIEQI